MSSATFDSLPIAGEVGTVDERVLSRHRELSELPEIELGQEALRLLRYELDLPADERRRRVIARLRAWLQLDLPSARRIADAFEAALAQLEPDERHMLRETEEDAVMDGLSYREFERLAAFMPSLQKWREPFWQDASLPAGGLPGSFAAALAWAGMYNEVY